MTIADEPEPPSSPQTARVAEASPASDPRSGRTRIIREAPAAVGAAWANALCASLAREGRAVEGGWPGTILEARALVSRHLYSELVGRDMRQPSREEVTTAAAAAYDCARTAWFAIERRSRIAARKNA